MKTETTSRIWIKPSSPTPPNLKTYKVSLLDQIATAIHGNMTFFFPAGAGQNSGDFAGKSNQLQRSIAETLTRFYPLAGRLLDAATVDCADDGMLFVEAVADGPLAEFLGAPDVVKLDEFIPTADPETVAVAGGALWIVKFTSFPCGGTALGLSLTHKIADIAALVTLLKSWTAACRGEADVVLPDFSGPSLLPPREIPGMSGSVSLGADKFVARRFVVPAPKLAELKAKLSAAYRHPSRVEAVLALVWKCAVSAAAKKSGEFRPTALFQAVNLRTRTDPPLPETAFGNFVWPFAVIVAEESDLEVAAMAKKMRDSMLEFLAAKANGFKGDEAFATIMSSLKERGELMRGLPGLRAYKCTSWCKFPLFEADFGWGRPAWMTSANKFVTNTVALMDTDAASAGGGGVEILLTLDEEEMGLLERDEEFLAYALVNPPIVVD